MTWIRKNAAHIVVLICLTISAVLLFFRYQASIYRVFAAVKDFALSMRYYFLQFFFIDSEVSVTELPDERLFKYLPFDVTEILRKFNDMWKMFFNSECFAAYLLKVSNFIYNFSVIVMLLLPCFLMLGFVLKKVLLQPNQDRHGEKSRSVLFAEKFCFRFGRFSKSEHFVELLCKKV